MTETEWLNGLDWHAMYRRIRDHATCRQKRLFSVACCRLESVRFFDPRIDIALKMAERCADDPATETIVTETWSDPSIFSSSGPSIVRESDSAQAVLGIWELCEETRTDNTKGEENDDYEIASAVLVCLVYSPSLSRIAGYLDPVESCIRDVERLGTRGCVGNLLAVHAAITQRRLEIADLIGDA